MRYLPIAFVVIVVAVALAPVTFVAADEICPNPEFKVADPKCKPYERCDDTLREENILRRCREADYAELNGQFEDSQKQIEDLLRQLNLAEAGLTINSLASIDGIDVPALRSVLVDAGYMKPQDSAAARAAGEFLLDPKTIEEIKSFQRTLAKMYDWRGSHVTGWLSNDQFVELVCLGIESPHSSAKQSMRFLGWMYATGQGRPQQLLTAQRVLEDHLEQLATPGNDQDREKALTNKLLNDVKMRFRRAPSPRFDSDIPNAGGESPKLDSDDWHPKTDWTKLKLCPRIQTELANFRNESAGRASQFELISKREQLDTEPTIAVGLDKREKHIEPPPN